MSEQPESYIHILRAVGQRGPAEPIPTTWECETVLTDCCLRRVPTSNACVMFWEMPELTPENFDIVSYQSPLPPHIECAEGCGCKQPGKAGSKFARGADGRAAMGIGNMWGDE